MRLFLACFFLLLLGVIEIRCQHVRSDRRSGTSVAQPKNFNRNPIYDFASNLYLTVAQTKETTENVLISPFSIRAITGLIYLASRGTTAEEIREALLFPENHDDFVEGLAKHMASTQIVQNSKFDVGNGIFLREGVYLNRTYSDIIRTRLRSEIQKTNFYTPKNAAKLINSWVANITRNRIRKLVDPASISSATSVLMANALYFSGEWQNPFDEADTSQGIFQLPSGQNLSIAMMQTENSYGYNYIKELEATGISLPFKDQRFEFIILKPDDSLEKLEGRLKTYAMNLLSNQIKKQNRNVFLKMPKFRLDVSYDLVDVFRGLGINDLFDLTRANLTGLTKLGDRHAVSQIVHQTALDIHERGAAAAAGTVVSVYPISSPSFFTVDRPFLFLLNDRLTGPVFIGRLVYPIQSKDTKSLN